MTINKLLKEALTDQQDIFGDELLEEVAVKDISQPQKRDEKISTTNFKSENPDIPQADKIQIDESLNSANSVEELNKMICDCTKCSLGETRNKFVFGVGNPAADIMLIGEAPGAEEDKQGEPFVGRAGKLLTDILKAINFEREEVYIANILKCRPPENRNPSSSEMIDCMPYLFRQIELIKPKIILCLGRVAATGLLNNNLSLTKMRGNIYEFHGVKLMVTYHPAALLRNPNWKKGCWEDVQKFRKLYEELTGEN